jgi:mannosyltransferase
MTAAWGDAGRVALVWGGAVLVLAAVNFLVGLGASSLYIDEGLSWSAASAPLGAVTDHVAAVEITPPLHYLGLHEVLRVSDSEVAMRLPSALAGIGLVAAVLGVGTRAAGRTAGRASATLAAVSPLILDYSQQARAYVFAALGVTLAAGAMLEAERRGRGSRGRRAWLGAAAAASVLAVWTHYTAALAILPLLASSAYRHGITRREALAVGGATGLGWLALAPLLLDQLDNGTEQGVAVLGALTVANVLEALGAPFDSSYGGYRLTFLTAVGAALMAGAVTAAATGRPRTPPLVRTLILPAAGVPVVAALVVTMLGPDVLVTRYLLVAVPFMLVLVGALIASLPRRAAYPTAGLALACAIAGSVAGHTSGGHWLDWRAATEVVRKEARTGDAVVLEYPPSGAVFNYYRTRAQLMWLQILPADDPRLRAVFAQRRRRLWLVNEPAIDPATVRKRLSRAGYGAQAIRRFEANEPLGVTLAVPLAR